MRADGEKSGFWRVPKFADVHKRRQARVLQSLLAAMSLTGVGGAMLSLFDPNNKLLTTFIFYSTAASFLGGSWLLVRRGHVVQAAWGLSLSFWVLIASSMLFFGGLKGQHASMFGVSVLLVGGVVGSRSAIVLTIVSSAWCGVIAYLELHSLLPQQFGAYSPSNAWTASSLSLLLMVVLLRQSLGTLKQMHARAEATAKERDDALRHSIQAQKMELVGNLSSGIAHDFNNLLTVIGGAATVLRESLQSDDPELQEVLSDLDSATTRAALMTRQLLSFGGSRGQELVVVDVGGILRSLEPMLPRLLGSQIIITSSAEASTFVRASRSGLEQILLNFAVNARDAMLSGGSLRFMVKGEEDSVILEAEDSGCGMDAATIARIFEPFFTTKSTGTGLGLSTIQQLVNRFGGTISVASKLGHGTRFTVRFPRSPEPAPTARLPAPAVLASQPRQRLLLVEDDLLVRRTTARLLEQAGYEVVAVSDGDEAMALLSSASDFICVVSDISMPRVNGDVLANLLGDHHPRMPVVLLSGASEPTGVFASAPRAFVPKPIDRDGLLHAILSVTGPQR